MKKHECLRIGILNQHEAIIYYKDGTTISLYCDRDVRSIIEIVCLPIGYEGTYEAYVHGSEDTMSIALKEVI